MKVAVYGSLRKGLGNYKHYLQNEKTVGRFETPPIYTLIDLGAFPGLIKKGATSVVMEVFEVDDNKVKELDRLEGYHGEGKSNFYNREEIDSPFGKVSTYFYNLEGESSSLLPTVSSGDWVDFYRIKKIIT